MRLTAEVIGRFEVPDDTPLNRLLVAKTLTLPLHVAPIGPGPNDKGWTVESDFLTYQARISQGDYYLPPLPYSRDLHPVTDTRERVVSEVLNDYHVGRGVPGDLDQHNALVKRILAGLDEHARRKADPDCDVCTPESHVDCQSTPYNGAAGQREGGHHYRCREHRTSRVQA